MLMIFAWGRGSGYMVAANSLFGAAMMMMMMMMMVVVVGY